MDYRTLGKTGLQVSPAGIGSWQLSGPLSLNGKADGFPELGRGQVIELIRGCGGFVPHWGGLAWAAVSVYCVLQICLVAGGVGGARGKYSPQCDSPNP